MVSKPCTFPPSLPAFYVSRRVLFAPLSRARSYAFLFLLPGDLQAFPDFSATAETPSLSKHFFDRPGAILCCLWIFEWRPGPPARRGPLLSWRFSGDGFFFFAAPLLVFPLVVMA